MNYTGILSPNGSFIECKSYGHLDLAKEIAEKLNSEYSYKDGMVCEEYLQKLGYVIVRARDVYGLIGYLDDNGKFIYLSDEQKKWLEEHYDKFPTDKQRCVDEVIDVVAERICFNGDYDCNVSYWEQIDALLEDEYNLAGGNYEKRGV